MNSRYIRIAVALVSLSILFGIDFWVNNRRNIDITILLFCAIAVSFHLVAFEAVFLKSKHLIMATWAVVLCASVFTVFYFEKFWQAITIVVFIVAYTVALLHFLGLVFHNKR